MHSPKTVGLEGTEDEEGEAEEEDAKVDGFGFDVFFVEGEDAVDEADEDAAAADHRHYGYH